MNAAQRQAYDDIKAVVGSYEELYDAITDMARDSALDALDDLEAGKADDNDYADARLDAITAYRTKLHDWYHELVGTALDTLPNPVSTLIREQVFGHGMSVFDELAEDFMEGIWEDALSTWKDDNDVTEDDGEES